VAVEAKVGPKAQPVRKAEITERAAMYRGAEARIMAILITAEVLSRVPEMLCEQQAEEKKIIAKAS
jgi:hypothetical protein